MTGSFHLPFFRERLIPRKNVVFVILLTIVSAIFLVLESRAQGSIGILPPSTSLTLFPGDSGSYQLKIHSGFTHPVTVRFSVVVSLVPPRGSAGDIILTFPSSLTIPFGNSFVTVMVTVRSAAAPGTYILTNTVTT